MFTLTGPVLSRLYLLFLSKATTSRSHILCSEDQVKHTFIERNGIYTYKTKAFIPCSGDPAKHVHTDKWNIYVHSQSNYCFSKMLQAGLIFFAPKTKRSTYTLRNGIYMYKTKASFHHHPTRVFLSCHTACLSRTCPGLPKESAGAGAGGFPALIYTKTPWHPNPAPPLCPFTKFR